MTKLRFLWGFAAVLMLAGCSSDSPTPVPDDPPVVYPEHPDKDWEGEKAHGFITDVSVVRIPVSDRGFLLVRRGEDGWDRTVDEIIIDPDCIPDTTGGWSDSPRRASDTGYFYSSDSWVMDGRMADPFENREDYISLCKSYKFKWQSKFADIEELAGLASPPVKGLYLCTEKLGMVDVYTEKYFDKNHPAGSSMRMISYVGMYFVFRTVDCDLLAKGKFYHEDWLMAELGISYENFPTMLDCVDVCVWGFPEKAGEYPMKLRMELNGKVVEQKFTVKYVDKQ